MRKCSFGKKRVKKSRRKSRKFGYKVMQPSKILESVFYNPKRTC